MSFTSTVKLEGSRNVPADSWMFAKDIEHSQPTNLSGRHNILFNKGRYFETTIYDKHILNEVSALTDLPIEYNTMIVGSWNKMEDFVIAMNILDYRVHIEVAWI